MTQTPHPGIDDNGNGAKAPGGRAQGAKAPAAKAPSAKAPAAKAPSAKAPAVVDPYAPTPVPAGAQQPVNAYMLPKTNLFAIISLVSAIAGAHLLGIVFGHIALVQIKRTTEDGRGLAIAGLIIGYALFAMVAVFFVLWLLAFAATLGLAFWSTELSYS